MSRKEKRKMPSDAQRRATKKYNKKTYIKYYINVNKEKFEDLIIWLDSKKSKNETIIKALQLLKDTEEKKF